MGETNFNGMPDLDQATVSNQELNHLAYSEDDYAKIDDVIAATLTKSGTPPVEIDLASLAVNGEVVQDDMLIYLNAKGNSSSALKEVLKTPLHYYHYKNQTFKKDKKKHFELGTFAHMAFIEPQLFDMVRVEPAESMASKEGVLALMRFYEDLNKVETSEFPDVEFWKIADQKRYLQQLQDACPYQMIQEEHKMIIDVLKRNYYSYGGGIIPLLLRGAKGEVSFYGTDDQTGLPVKVRPDFINIEENIGANAIISFKTTASDSIDKFLYDSAKYKYEMSEGMYLDVCSKVSGRKFTCVITIMLQTVAPYLPAVLFWDAEDLQNGKYKYRQALDTVFDCYQQGAFPGFDAKAPSGNYGIIEMKQPEWALKEIHPVSMED